MQVECFIKTHSSKDGVDNRRENICKELGLLNQAFVDTTDGAEKYYPAMTNEESLVWLSFLPDSYSKNRGEWENYDFDIIPTEALDAISAASSLRIFTDFEIWTPMGVNKDPAVIGLVGSIGNPNTTYHMIVRWGESLMDFLKIKEIVFSEFRDFRNSEEEIKAPSIVKDYMNSYILSCHVAIRYDLFKTSSNVAKKMIFFKGVSWRKSSCCKAVQYKFISDYIYIHRLCSCCGNIKIKKKFGD